jgi:antitoxin component YwqK of YwqJK toxin-antitoxin module
MKMRIQIPILLMVLMSICSSAVAQKKKYFDINDRKCKENRAYYYRIVVQQGTMYKMTEYYMENNQIKKEGQYRSKKLEENTSEGEFNWYYSNGQKYIAGQYKNGKAEEKWTYWYKDGQVKGEGNYERDHREGEWIFYHRNGKVVSKRQYKEGDLNGLYQEFYDNGDKRIEENYAKGKSHGEFITYYEGGKIRVKGSYEKDSLDGTYEKYWRSGTILLRGEYTDNKRTGTWEFYHSNGNKSCDVEYNKGKFSKGNFYDEEGKKLSKKVSREDLYKEAEHPDGEKAMYQAIGKKLGEKMDFRGAKADKYIIFVKVVLTIDEEGNITKREWKYPGHDDDLFEDKWDIVKYVNSAIDDFPKFKPTKAYNRNVEDEVTILLYYDFGKM